MTLVGLTRNSSRKERLMARIGEPDDKGCWPWIGGLRSNGYGMFAILRNGKWSQTTAHRVSYQEFVCDIPEDAEIDHLCRNRRCVNPNHLEAVTVQENRKRRNAEKTHCSNGHIFTDENTYWWTDRDGYACRLCRTCRSDRGRKRK